MPAPRLVVVGASAGGVEALSRLLASLPPDLPAAVLVVMHMATGDHHLMVDGDCLAQRPRENGHRPAPDPLFRSPTRAHGPRVAGAVPSGNLADGAQGLAHVARHGGLALVQDPAEALFDGMPRSAIAAVDVDAMLSAAGLARAIEWFARAQSSDASVGRAMRDALPAAAAPPEPEARP